MFRVPQLSERILPFAVLVGAMSCYLTLSRRLELVVARAAGVSAWQFVAPSMIAAFLFGAVATTVYNPLAAVLHERSKRLEAEMMGELPSSALQENTQRVLGAPEERRRRGHHQCQVEPRAGRPARRRHRLHVRQRRPVPGADRGKERDAGARLLALRRRAHLRERQSARGPRQLSARHQPDARTGAGKLCHARNGAVLATALLYRAGRSRRTRSPPVIGCNISSCCRAPSCSPRWSCSRLR